MTGWGVSCIAAFSKWRGVQLYTLHLGTNTHMFPLSIYLYKPISSKVGKDDLAAFSKAMSNKNGIDIDAALQNVRAGGTGAPLNGGTGGNSDLVGLTDIAKSMLSQSSATMQSAQLQVR